MGNGRRITTASRVGPNCFMSCRLAPERVTASGMPWLAAKELTGHKEIKTTMRYCAEATKKALRKGVNKIAEVG